MKTEVPPAFHCRVPAATDKRPASDPTRTPRRRSRSPRCKSSCDLLPSVLIHSKRCPQVIFQVPAQLLQGIVVQWPRQLPRFTCRIAPDIICQPGADGYSSVSHQINEQPINHDITPGTRKHALHNLSMRRYGARMSSIKFVGNPQPPNYARSLVGSRRRAVSLLIRQSGRFSRLRLDIAVRPGSTCAELDDRRPVWLDAGGRRQRRVFGREDVGLRGGA
jgi:hypothetical protein